MKAELWRPGPDLCRGMGTGDGVSYLGEEQAALWFEWVRVIRAGTDSPMSFRFLAWAKGPMMGSFTNTEGK